MNRTRSQLDQRDGGKLAVVLRQMLYFPVFVIAWCVPIAQGQPPAETEDPPDALSFDETPRAYAFDAQAGILAVSSLAERQISLFDPADFGPGVRPEPRHVAVNGNVACIISRQLDNRSLFVAAMSDPPSLLLMETNGKILKRYRLEETPLQLFASADKNDPYVYWKSKELVQFDLRKLVIASEPRAGGVLLNVAPNGSLFYIASQFNHLQFGRRELNAPPAPPRDWKTVPVGGPVYVANPLTGAVASGKVLYSADLTTVIATYNFSPQQVFPDQPLVVGFRENIICVASTNTNEIVAEYALPAKWFQAPKTREHRQEPCVYLDSSRGRLIAVNQRGLLAVQLSDLKLSSEPSLSPSAPLPEIVTFGETLELDIPFSNPGPKVVSLNDAPQGMTISGRKVRWTPTSDQIGDHQLQLIAQSDDINTVTAWRVNVRLPAITLPLKPMGIDVTEDESRAVVWGNGVINGTNAKLAVIDLHSGAILEKEFKDNPFLSATIDGTSIFLLRKAGIEQLKLPEFEVVATATLSTNETLAEMRVVGSRRLIFGERRFDLPGLTPGPTFKHDIHRQKGWLTGSTAFGTMIDGILWNQDFSAPQMLIWPAMLYRHGPDSVQWKTSHNEKQFQVHADAWYPCGPVIKSSANYARDLRKGIGGIRNPFTFFVIENRETNGIEIVPTNQLTGAIEDPYRLLIENRSNESLRLFCGRDKFQLLKGSELVSGSLAQWSSRPLPFHIQPTQSEFFLKSETPVHVKYVAEGATNFRLEMVHDYTAPRTVLESKSGEFDLKIPPTHQLAIDKCASLVFNLDHSDQKCDARLQEYVKPIEDWYKEVFGRSANGKFPVPVTVMVTAEHPDHGDFTLLHSYIYEVPQDAILESMQKTFPFAK